MMPTVRAERRTALATVGRMPISPYIARLRARVGTDLLMLPGVSAVVRNDRGQILPGRRSDDGSWGLPAGAIDPGEQPADAVVREIYEETGVVAEIERIGGVALSRRTNEVWYFANAQNNSSLDLHATLGFVEVPRDFWFPDLTFDGGEGVLSRASLDNPTL
jgi:8-oxo-dGTP pyrophosphatase MutT (NUDIX family)